GAGTPMTAGQIVEALSGTQHWKPRTVKTLLARLVKKHAVRCDLDDKRYVYRAVITRQDAVRREARWFLKRVFDGALVPAVVTFLSETDLTTEDLKQLRQILQKEAKR
ncbi:MAG TPA: BlaI/MecI/CopY family transcriptional regulator, partial [Gemmataceae bacterium]